MNVRGLANAAIQQVNQNSTVEWVRSQGYTTADDGQRTPVTKKATVRAQVQGLSAKDLAHIEGLNIEGVKRSVHMYGNVQGVVRATKQGGDILRFPETPCGAVRDWLIVSVMETWATWARVIVVMQNTVPVQ